MNKGNEEYDPTDELDKTDEVESKAIVISPAKDIFAKVDTGELLEHLRGRVTGAWAYKFPMEGKEVTGLSAPGTDEACIFIAQQSGGQYVIKTIKGSLNVIEEPDCFKVQVMAGVYVMGIVDGKPVELPPISTHLGYCKQDKWGIYSDSKANQDKGIAGKRYTIRHAEVIAVRKAERNAKNHAMPDKIRQAIIDQALKEGKTSDADTEDTEAKMSAKQKGMLENLCKNEKVKPETREAVLRELLQHENRKRIMTLRRASDWIKILLKEAGTKDNGPQSKMDV